MRALTVERIRLQDTFSLFKRIFHEKHDRQDKILRFQTSSTAWNLFLEIIDLIRIKAPYTHTVRLEFDRKLKVSYQISLAISTNKSIFK